ncbi:MAG TPA: DUF4174 domain-containing protein [Rhizobiaceae bacterium]|nr:DUF4174 domain-containing protein [Rhizobiaceae bacterium]
MFARSILLRLSLAIALLAPMMALAAPLEKYRFQNRILLVFAPDPSDTRLSGIRAEFKRFGDGFAERDLRVFVVTRIGKTFELRNEAADRAALEARQDAASIDAARLIDGLEIEADKQGDSTEETGEAIAQTVTGERKSGEGTAGPRLAVDNRATGTVSDTSGATETAALDLPDASGLPDEPANTLRAAFGIFEEGFTTVLIGKDGGVKYRAGEAVSARKLFALIDAMPMRKAEMEAQAKALKEAGEPPADKNAKPKAE